MKQNSLRDRLAHRCRCPAALQPGIPSRATAPSRGARAAQRGRLPSARLGERLTPRPFPTLAQAAAAIPSRGHPT